MLIKQTLFIEFYYYSPPANRAVIPKEVRLRDLPGTSLPFRTKCNPSLYILGDSRPYRTVRSGGSRSFLPRNDGERNGRRNDRNEGSYRSNVKRNGCLGDGEKNDFTAQNTI